eukprot:3628440-Heterocapsa_arctica.AAC.1
MAGFVTATVADEHHAPERREVPPKILTPENVLLELSDGLLPRPLQSTPNPTDPKRVGPPRGLQTP